MYIYIYIGLPCLALLVPYPHATKKIEAILYAARPWNKGGKRYMKSCGSTWTSLFYSDLQHFWKSFGRWRDTFAQENLFMIFNYLSFLKVEEEKVHQCSQVRPIYAGIFKHLQELILLLTNICLDSMHKKYLGAVWDFMFTFSGGIPLWAADATFLRLETIAARIC